MLQLLVLTDNCPVVKVLISRLMLHSFITPSGYCSSCSLLLLFYKSFHCVASCLLLKCTSLSSPPHRFFLCSSDFRKTLPPVWAERRLRTTSCCGTLLFLGESCSKCSSSPPSPLMLASCSRLFALIKYQISSLNACLHVLYGPTARFSLDLRFGSLILVETSVQAQTTCSRISTGNNNNITKNYYL